MTADLQRLHHLQVDGAPASPAVPRSTCSPDERGRAVGIAQGYDASTRRDTGKARPRLSIRAAAALVGIAAALQVAACCRDRVVEHAVPISPPSCRERDHPEPPDAPSGSQAWADWFALELVPWIVEVERACPRRFEHAISPADSKLDSEQVTSPVGHYGD